MPFHNMSLPSPTLLSMDVLTHVYPLLKHLFSKIFPMAKTCSTCLKTTYKRSKCLVLSRRVQDPSATRTEANVFPKTSTMEQISETTDRLGSERDVVEGSYLRSFTSGRRISQSDISSREGGWGNRPVINLKNLNKFVPHQHFKMERFHCLKFLLQNGDYMCKIDLKESRKREVCTSSFASVLDQDQHQELLPSY